jgi:hypothetical protein
MNALIFDYDGLIVDTETCVAQVVVDLCSERGFQIELSSLAPFVGDSGSEGQHAWEEWLRRLLGDEADPTAFDELVAERVEPLLPGLDVTTLLSGAPGERSKSSRPIGFKLEDIDASDRGAQHHRGYCAADRLTPARSGGQDVSP